ncbi:MAG TPA: methionine--tRNA ligase subunit beta [Phycisphaerae bacterium]|nr:methionine--tRNA ligase subunit beta [Phycisphaerae bacterium]
MSEMPGIITYDDFVKLDLRIARVVEATAHPNADKLLILQVDMGTERRQLVAGLRGYYEPADLVGKLIVVVANLAPRMMRGQESRGMLLAASSDDHSKVILLTAMSDIAPGSKVS